MGPMDEDAAIGKHRSDQRTGRDQTYFETFHHIKYLETHQGLGSHPEQTPQRIYERSGSVLRGLQDIPLRNVPQTFSHRLSES